MQLVLGVDFSAWRHQVRDVEELLSAQDRVRAGDDVEVMGPGQVAEDAHVLVVEGRQLAHLVDGRGRLHGGEERRRHQLGEDHDVAAVLVGDGGEVGGGLLELRRVDAILHAPLDRADASA